MFEVPHAAALAALTERWAELAKEIREIEAWRIDAVEPELTAARDTAYELVLKLKQDSSNVTVPLVPSGQKVFDLDPPSRETIIALYRFDKAMFDRYEAVCGPVRFE